MDRLSSLSRFKASCPFLARTKNNALRTLCTTSSNRFPSISALTERATKCPAMGPALNARSKELAAGYASIAGNTDFEQIHKDQGINVPAGATIEMCPHASAARNAARVAADLHAAAKDKSKAMPAKKVPSDKAAAAAAGCPFHAKQTADATENATTSGLFNYQSFYSTELQKKHDDKSYRYFNNINRLAKKFPIAHTAEPKDEVQVWCSNDYLGMGNNPVVLETMQYVSLLTPRRTYSDFRQSAVPSTSTVMALEVPVTSQAMVPFTSSLSKSSPDSIVKRLP